MVKISVKTLDSITHEFDVSNELTIRQFKDLISPTISIPNDKIRLIFKGNVLDDSATIESCELENATIHAVERLPRIPAPEPQQQQQQTAPTETPSSRTEPIGAEDFAGVVQRIVRTVQSSFLDSRGTTSSVLSRLEISNRFFDHLNNTIQQQFPDTSVLSEFISNTPININDTNSANIFTRLSQQLHRLRDGIQNLTPLLEAYEHFISLAGEDNASNLTGSNLYPTLPDTVSTALHSLAHCLHNLSDIFVHAQTTDPTAWPFRLVVPRYPRLYSGEAQNTSDISETTERSTSTNPVPQPYQLPQIPVVSGTTGNSTTDPNLGYHLTVHLTADFADTYSDANPQLIVFNDNFPTVTASQTPQTPILIRTTAGSSNSGNRPENQQNIDQNRHFSIDSPNDPFLVCHSLLANSAVTIASFVSSPRTESIGVQSQQPPSMEPQTPSPPSSSSTPPPPPPTSISLPSSHLTPPPPSQSEPQHERAQRNHSDNIRSWTEVFPTSTVPVIKSDVKRLKTARKMPPFSDGYHSASYFKRKRFSEQDEAFQYLQIPLSQSFVRNLEGLSLRDVDVDGLRSAIENDNILQEEYNDTINNVLTDALKKYEKIDPDRYPECYKFLNKK